MYWESIRPKRIFEFPLSQSDDWYVVFHYWYWDSEAHIFQKNYILRAERNLFSIYCDGDYFQHFIYSQKCMCL
jgi:hypothetical protein